MAGLRSVSLRPVGLALVRGGVAATIRMAAAAVLLATRGALGRRLLGAGFLHGLGGLLGLVRDAPLARGDVLELRGVLLERLRPSALVDQVLRLAGDALEVHSPSLPVPHSSSPAAGMLSR